MKKIAIIGFGFCGRLAFYHLVKRSDKDTKIFLFDRNGQGTIGAAFSSFSPHYILNVPTTKMSAFPDEPQDFCCFLKKNYPRIFNEIGENGFAPRQIYGEYLEQITCEAFANAKKNAVEFEFISREVIEITQQNKNIFSLKTKNNTSFEASEILLATSFCQSDLPYDFEAENFEENLVKKIWQIPQHPVHKKNLIQERICIIGSGLTAVDAIVGLKKKNFKGKIFVISRRGNFPKEHNDWTEKSPDFISASDAKKGVIFLVLKIRNFLRQNTQFNLCHVIDSIRPITTELWKNLDQKNKKLFLRHLVPYWNIFRHRAPVSSIKTIEKMIKSGQIEIKKKGVKKIYQESAKILVETAQEKIECDYFINCLGFEFRAQKYPLLAQMITADLLKEDVLLSQSNHPKIHLLGGLNIGRDFECTSVPDLRLSVEDVLKKLS